MGKMKARKPGVTTFFVMFFLFWVLFLCLLLQHQVRTDKPSMPPPASQEVGGAAAPPKVPLENDDRHRMHGVDGGDDDGTLVPIADIPKSPYYSFDPRIMPPRFLRYLQRSSRRITDEWEKSFLRSYDSADISDCDTLTPECALHKYLLKAGKEDPNNKPYRKCCVEHKALREITIWVTRKLTMANIKYFVTTGTALGVRRHAGTIIPWDTDADIAIYPQDRTKLRKLFEHNTKYFFNEMEGKPLYRLHHSKGGNPPRAPFIDMFYDPVYTEKPEFFLPLEVCLFYGQPVMCPNVRQLDEWFLNGLNVYAEGHYYGPNNCSVRENGLEIFQSRC